ncbi:YdeI/OmpD-associated family protein [Paraflavisolibacter sp. H34]|uniref:YdeI/OmpD-associated family protein n=1 Tax=Huijunlia imazamoxiresistens TaxID=3127457 RepID=UPI003016CBB8
MDTSLIPFTALVKQFDEQGEKTGWTYIEIPAGVAQRLAPGNKKAFRVKGTLDSHAIAGISLLPMGDGSFILPLNADLRRALRKQKGAFLEVRLQADRAEKQLPPDLLECLADEPQGAAFFRSLTPSHQHYFGNWIQSAKTEPTRTKRIAQAVSALCQGQTYPEMLRSGRKDSLEF